MPSDRRDDPTPDLTLYTDAEARAIWARAAQLQAECDADVRRAYGTEVADEGMRPSQAVSVTAPAGMFLAHEVRAAAHEAGIDAACVALAMAEHDAIGRETDVVPTDADVRRFVRELGTATGSVRATGLVAGDRDAVVTRLRSALARAPYHVTFDGRASGEGGVGEVLRFRLPAWGSEVDGAQTLGNAFVYNAARIGVDAVHVLVAPRGTREQPACEVTVVADLRPGAHFNAGAMLAIRAAMPVLTGILGWTLGSVTGDLALAGAALGTAAGALLVPALRAVMHWEQRTAMRVLQRSLDAMLRDTTRGGDASPVLPSRRHASGPALPPATGDDVTRAMALA